jgi:UV DNA damage repair endonuclease
MARWMGYGQTFQDFKINVHISGKRGPAGIRSALKRLSPEARNCITIENDEMSWGVDASLELVNDCALVLDIHHHWIRTGEYIQPTDDRVSRLIDSWRGVRPVCHYSVSREDVLVNHAVDAMPNHTELLELGYKKQKMRAHSDWYWNQPVTDWALGFWENFDIMCESKAKNLSSAQVYNRAQELNLV